MSVERPEAGGHPAPHADRLSGGLAFFMLFAGPVAWFVQLLASVPLAGWPCFPMTDRLSAPMAGYGWTWMGSLIVLVLCLAVALASGFISLAKLREVAGEKEGGHAELIEVGHGRTRFTAMWGVVLSFGFALASLLTFAGLFMVPRCAG